MLPTGKFAVLSISLRRLCLEMAVVSSRILERVFCGVTFNASLRKKLLQASSFSQIAPCVPTVHNGKKPTKFMTWGSHAGDVNLRSCNSRSICSFSCKAHEQLSSATRVLIDGKVKDKCFATKKGQVYPNRLVKDLLNQLLHLQ